MKLPRQRPEEPKEATIREIRLFARQIARLANESGFFPNLVIGVEIGGHILGRLVAHELRVPLETVVVRRRTTSLMRSAIMRRIAKTRSGDTIGKLIDKFSNYGNISVKQSFEGEIKPNQKVLIVDDGTNTGRTMETVKKLLSQKGMHPHNIKTACVNAEGNSYKPDFFLTKKPIYWPWSVFSPNYDKFRKWRKKQLNRAVKKRNTRHIR